MQYSNFFFLFFFFNDTATTEIYTLSLHDALPIWLSRRLSAPGAGRREPWPLGGFLPRTGPRADLPGWWLSRRGRSAVRSPWRDSGRRRPVSPVFRCGASLVPGLGHGFGQQPRPAGPQEPLTLHAVAVSPREASVDICGLRAGGEPRIPRTVIGRSRWRRGVRLGCGLSRGGPTGAGFTGGGLARDSLAHRAGPVGRHQSPGQHQIGDNCPDARGNAVRMSG